MSSASPISTPISKLPSTIRAFFVVSASASPISTVNNPRTPNSASWMRAGSRPPTSAPSVPPISTVSAFSSVPLTEEKNEENSDTDTARRQKQSIKERATRHPTISLGSMRIPFGVIALACIERTIQAAPDD